MKPKTYLSTLLLLIAVSISSFSKIITPLNVEQTKISLDKNSIYYRIQKNHEQSTLEGTFNSMNEVQILEKAINEDDLIQAINIDIKRSVSKENLIFTKKILDFFDKNYIKGTIIYENNTFTIGGIAKDLKSKVSMNKLLKMHTQNFHNNTEVLLSKERKEENELRLNLEKKAEQDRKTFLRNKAKALSLELEERQQKLNTQKKLLKIQEKINTIVALNLINFESSQSKLTENMKKNIQKISIILKNYSNIKIKILGYTDNVGAEYLNLKLSKDRVTNVKKFLIEEGINSKRLVVKGYGSKRPLVPNNSPENRKKNRRVEFKVIKNRKSGK